MRCFILLNRMNRIVSSFLFGPSKHFKTRNILKQKRKKERKRQREKRVLRIAAAAKFMNSSSCCCCCYYCFPSRVVVGWCDSNHFVSFCFVFFSVSFSRSFHRFRSSSLSASVHRASFSPFFFIVAVAIAIDVDVDVFLLSFSFSRCLLF